MEWARSKADGMFYMLERYSSLNEYAEIADARGGARVKYKSPYEDNYMDEWYGCNFDEAMRLSRVGWDEQRPQALDIADKAVKRAEMEIIDDRFAAEWDVTGAEVDMGRYLSKVPECMIDFPIREVPTVGTVATLVASKSVSAAIEPETMIRLGTVVSALAMALDRLGVNTELYIDVAQLSGRYHMYQSVLVKGANDSIDPASILFAFAHPATFRRLGFATWDNMNGDSAFSKKFGEDSGGRGMPWSRPKQVKEMFPEGTIFLPSLKSGQDVPNADQFLKKYLTQLGLIEGE